MLLPAGELSLCRLFPRDAPLEDVLSCPRQLGLLLPELLSKRKPGGFGHKVAQEELDLWRFCIGLLRLLGSRVHFGFLEKGMGVCPLVLRPGKEGLPVVCQVCFCSLSRGDRCVSMLAALVCSRM